VRVKDSIAATKTFWLKPLFANLICYVPSGIYFSRIRVRGKLIRRLLKTNKLSVAKLRLDGENVIEFPKLPEFQPVTLKVLRWEEKDKRFVIKDAELVPN